METGKVSEHDERLKKLEELKGKNINPYPASTKTTIRVEDVLADFEKLEADKTSISLAGRLMSKRTHGNLSFANLKNNGHQIQIAFSKNEIGVDSYKDFVKLIDMGDFLEITGECFLTHKGEQSIMVKSWKLLTKALLPLPEKWHGLKDDEEIIRKRYLELLTNDDHFQLFIQRAKFWEVTRNFLKSRGFLEVETPTIENTTGGAEAAPFKTRHNDFGIDVYMRISIGELWQKRLMAAGYEKTFEIGRAYRNEGTSPNHLQEFTNMEFYWAYADYKDGMKLTRELYLEIANQVFGKTKFSSRGYEFDLAGEWPEIDYRQEVLKQTGIDVLHCTERAIMDKLTELGVKSDAHNKERLIDSLWKYCRKNIAGPAFLVRHPKMIAPLSKESTEFPGTVEKFQIILCGSEIGNGYSELNDPIDQRERFEAQQKLMEAGDDEAMMPDWDFVEMLEHGMPPTFGFGFGERLFAALCDKTLREATLFPLIKPKKL